MENRKGLLVLAVIVGALALVGWPYLRFLQFTLQANERLDELGRFPSTEQMAAMKGVLGADAARYGFEAATVEVEVVLRAQGPVVLRYFRARVASGGHRYRKERQIETPIDEPAIADLGARGVPVTRE